MEKENKKNDMSESDKIKLLITAIDRTITTLDEFKFLILNMKNGDLLL